jgi:RNA polymerase II subunit A small phosphatase-like protein
LPPQNKKDLNKITLVLDIDETLIHSSFSPQQGTEFHFSLSNDISSCDIYVSVRPGVREFIDTLSKYYEIVAFTSSSKPYADQVLDYIDPSRKIKYRLYRESCAMFNNIFVKDLSKLGRDLKRTIIIDNAPSSYMLQPYNAIAISDWIDNTEDKELYDICEFLVQNHQCKNVMDLFANDL